MSTVELEEFAQMLVKARLIGKLTVGLGKMINRNTGKLEEIVRLDSEYVTMMTGILKSKIKEYAPASIDISSFN